jgi:hypothetical protein
LNYNLDELKRHKVLLLDVFLHNVDRKDDLFFSVLQNASGRYSVSLPYHLVDKRRWISRHTYSEKDLVPYADDPGLWPDFYPGSAQRMKSK